MSVTVKELAPVGRLSVRTERADAEGLVDALGLELPQRIGTRATTGGRDALCVGPDEWTVTLPEVDCAAVIAALDELDEPACAVDISHRETTFAIEGPDGDTLLSMGCPIDVTAIESGAGTRTVFADVPVTLWRDGPTLVRMDVWRSFAPQVRTILEDGLGELAAQQKLRAA